MAKSIKELSKIKTLVTHNGVMHGDDVIATAFLMCAGGIIGHSFKVERVIPLLLRSMSMIPLALSLT